tara:strand:+ start:3293 stop:3673 length:381 start_codon:yes stop_codon:yes gene_type:complete
MSDTNKRSVLIVDNDNAILNNLVQRFKKLDLMPITAKDGYEGYSRACKEHPDYVVTETLLPSMNGFRIARLLKFDDRYKNSKVILVTTNDLESSRALFESSGADKIIRKPFRFKELIDAMNIGEEV